MVKRKKRLLVNRRDALVSLLLLLGILALVNVISQFYYYRWDLTAEKRYSISKPTQKVVKDLKDVVTIKIFLDGELNAGFTRLQDATRNLMKEFRAYGGKNIEYQFIDPMAITNLDERQAFMKDLISRGLTPTNLTTQSKTDSKNQLIFPGAIVAFGSNEVPIQLLENQMGFSPQMILNNSEVALEYKFANAIQKLTQYRPPSVAFLKGNNELSEIELADIKQSLEASQFVVDNFILSNHPYIPQKYDAVVVAKPRIAFNEQDKYKIDQYIMRGGKVLWLVDGTNADMDSLRTSPVGQFATGNDFNLDDMLFKYGVRINTDVVQDINLCNPIPLVIGQMGDAPQTKMFPWYYYPLLVSDNKNAIVKNLDPVASFFASSIDTINNPGIKRTILLHTTENAKAQMAPTRIHFGILQSPPNKEYYNQPDIPVAVLLEGEFESVFKNRVSPEFLAGTDTMPSMRFTEKSKASKMIIVSDGDIIRSEVRADSSAYPLGYYYFTKQQFANKDFILNCIAYLTDDSGILEARNKDMKLRMLNSVKVEEGRLVWQLLNIAAPIVIIILFGVGFSLYRKRKYTA